MRDIVTWRRASVIAIAVVITASVHACGSEPLMTDPQPPVNAAPTANAGTDRTVNATLPVTLDGSASSDGDGDAITYTWTFVSQPTGSVTTFDDASAARPSFTPDVPGTYTISLVVNDGTADSTTDQVVINAQDATAIGTIGAAGGQVVSTDGRMTLTVPAGALAADEEISITVVPPDQYPEGISGLGELGVVYDMRPDGLTFSTPATIVMRIPDIDPVTSGDVTTAPTGMIASIAGSDVTISPEVESVYDKASGDLVVTGTVDHFSFAAGDRLRVASGSAEGVTLQFQSNPPNLAQVGIPFEVRILAFAPGTPLPGGSVAGSVTDASSPQLDVVAPFDGTLMDVSTAAEFRMLNDASWQCLAEGEAEWSVDVQLSIADVFAVGRLIPGPTVVRTRLTWPVFCQAPPVAFAPMSVAKPEGAHEVESSALVPTSRRMALYSRAWGVTFGDREGNTVAELEANPSTTGDVFDAYGVTSDGVLAATSTGLLQYAGELSDDLPTLPPSQFMLTPYPQPAGAPDLATRVTDVVASRGAGADRQVAAVLFEEQALAFFTLSSAVGGAAGFVHDASFNGLFDAPGGGSIFGDRRPVTAHVGPNGFGEGRPMLVGLVDPSGAGTIAMLTWLSGVIDVFEFTGLFPGNEIRRLRCLLNVCISTAFGSGIGFGGIDIFLWEGATTASFITGRIQKAIGVDMREAEDGTILIASTDFNNHTVWIDYVSPTGEYLDSESITLPTGHTGPGHVFFDSDNRVIVACNTSNTIVAVDFGSE